MTSTICCFGNDFPSRLKEKVKRHFSFVGTSLKVEVLDAWCLLAVFTLSRLSIENWRECGEDVDRDRYDGIGVGSVQL